MAGPNNLTLGIGQVLYLPIMFPHP